MTTVATRKHYLYFESSGRYFPKEDDLVLFPVKLGIERGSLVTPLELKLIENAPRNILIYVTFSTLFIAFLLIFPGIRKERFSTLITVTTSLIVGATILLANYGTDWHVSEASISTPYRAFSREKLFADISVRIGLNSVNVTLQATQLKMEFRDALIKGLPFPILTIAEYLSQNMEGFSWGGKYRKAGYYTSIMLW
ncbi:dual oxidase maturation factor 1 [Trichonephila inaurata madagascariensis]|uniref:Dual oxidase maturation factor 1 n=1 Tax=Trichonephila inaurata madagascariensis TaxID=2747483 RepID=A0A8X6IAQ2_9ARAC|nr:dual oxidase maturation factor 1 [Trichonephila inaurata madagascariensis]